MSTPPREISTELLYDILNWTWSSWLTPAERVRFVTTSRLVSKTWSGVYDDLFSKDIHIPAESFYLHLFGSNCDFSRCRSITFTVFSNLQLSDGWNRFAPNSLQFVLRSDMEKLTSLYAVNIDHYNHTPTYVYDKSFFSTLPGYLPKFTVSYILTDNAPRETLYSLHRHAYCLHNLDCVAECQVGTLEVNGTYRYFEILWENVFPTRENFISNGGKDPILG